MAVGFVAALVYLRRRFAAGLPVATVGRVVIAGGIAAAAGRFFPGQGKVATLAALATSGTLFLVVLVALREFGPEDKAKVLKILRVRR